MSSMEARRHASSICLAFFFLFLCLYTVVLSVTNKNKYANKYRKWKLETVFLVENTKPCGPTSNIRDLHCMNTF